MTPMMTTWIRRVKRRKLNEFNPIIRLSQFSMKVEMKIKIIQTHISVSITLDKIIGLIVNTLVAK
jgi:hypothetical protein